MPIREGYAEGIPCWVDLATPDLETATVFYGALFGWELETDESWAGRAIATRKGLPAAGIGPLPGPDAPSVWSTYFAVDDANATVARIESAGGSLTSGPDEVAALGRIATAADPTGAAFGILQAGARFGAGIVNEHGGLNWNELITEDTREAVEFYVDVFGHDTGTASTPGGREYTMLRVDGRDVAGIIAPAKPGQRSHWTAYFTVDEVRAAADTAESAGGRVSYGPVDQPDVGTFLGLVDPLGARLTVIELAGEVD